MSVASGPISTGLLAWGLGLAVAFPLAMVALNEVILRLHRARNPIAGTLRVVRNLVVPLLTLDLLVARVIRPPAEGVSERLIETLLWITVLWAGLCFINDVVFGAVRAGSWQERVPKLLRDLTRVMLVGVGAAIVYSWVWGKSLEGAFAALGVGSIVIGLALQDPLGNIISGLMLLVERPLAVGDWISVSGTTGRVIEINWRSVHVVTLTADTLIVPNSELYKGSFTNLTKPDRRRTEIIELGFSYEDPPNRVKGILLELVRDTPGALDDPAPVVRTVRYDDFSVVYEVHLSAADPEALLRARDEFMTRVWYATRRHGITIPFPTAVQYEGTLPEQSDAADFPEVARRFPQFVGASEPPIGLPTRSYAAGERVVAERELLPGLCLVLKGSAALLVKDRAGESHEIDRVGPGSYFGEAVLLADQASELEVRAIEDLEVIVLAADQVHTLVERTPQIGRELGSLIEVRRKAASVVRRARLLGRG